MTGIHSIDMEAFVFVECAKDKDEAVKQALQRSQYVVEVYAINGGIFDLVVKMQAADERKLREGLRQIKGIDSVTSTLTSIVYNSIPQVA